MAQSLQPAPAKKKKKEVKKRKEQSKEKTLNCTTISFNRQSNISVTHFSTANYSSCSVAESD
jgi:hypothetical protein